MNSTEGQGAPSTCQTGHRWAGTYEVSVKIIQVCFLSLVLVCKAAVADFRRNSS